ncbi:hypothetical protein B0H19DRAFT_1376427 [Mycena capillaripes]|nr:hypothetical protein B0H19DRAFT_1376427 [Mycena capillaripes]
MPPRAKKRQVRIEPDLPQRHSTQLPQELIDAIIDEFDASLTDDTNDTLVFPDRKALRSCALVCRAFVRPSQRNLFSTVNTRHTSYSQGYDERCRLFAKLLSSASHIGKYVKNLILGYRPARSTSLAQILSSLPNLETISLYPWCDYRQSHYQLPAYHRDSFLAVFSLSSLRYLKLRDHEFSTVLELQSVLSNSIGLEELVLHNVTFSTLSAPATRSEPPRVVLKSLEFKGMRTTHVDAMLDSFSIVDLRHLRSLCSDRYHKSLFETNAHSIQDLTLIIHVRPGSFPETMPLPPGLRSLHLKICSCFIITSTIRRLGDLAAVKTLKRVSITVPGAGETAPFLSEIDPLLAEVGSQLEQLHLKLNQPQYHQEDAIELVVRKAMTTLNPKGILRVSFLSTGMCVWCHKLSHSHASFVRSLHDSRAAV